MQTIIQSFSDLKTSQYGPSAKVKLGNGDQVYVNEDPTNLVGKTVDIDVTEKSNKDNTRKYKVGKITKVYEATAASSNGNSNGKITWDAYRAMAEAAHSLATKLEPDGTDLGETQTAGEDHTVPIVVIDRSAARAAILNTCMIAYSKGLIFVPPDDDDIPPF